MSYPQDYGPAVDAATLQGAIADLGIDFANAQTVQLAFPSATVFAWKGTPTISGNSTGTAADTAFVKQAYEALVAAQAAVDDVVATATSTDWAPALWAGGAAAAAWVFVWFTRRKR